MKGLKKVAKESRYGTDIYYNIITQTVNTSGDGHFVTTLLRENTEKEIEAAVNRWLMM